MCVCVHSCKCVCCDESGPRRLTLYPAELCKVITTKGNISNRRIVNGKEGAGKGEGGGRGGGGGKDEDDHEDHLNE